VPEEYPLSVFRVKKLPTKLTTLGYNPEEPDMYYKTVYTAWIKQQ